MEPMTSRDYAPFLPVEEVAAILRISRSTAYEQANAWLASGSSTGLPCVRVGRRILVLGAAIAEVAQSGRRRPARTVRRR
jgi:hypothetical protein